MNAANGAALISVNVSAGTMVTYRGKPVKTGIFKIPVTGRVRLEGVNVRGDDQADRGVHGGPDRAVYAHALEDYEWWENELGQTMAPGRFGENFTLHGVDVSSALVGERWKIGDAVVQVASPRVPCFKLGIAMGDQKFVRRFAEALRPGAYLRIVQEGEIGAGDSVSVVSRPNHHLTVIEMMRIYLFERTRLREMLVPELPDSWRDWVSAG